MTYKFRFFGIHGMLECARLLALQLLLFALVI